MCEITFSNGAATSDHFWRRLNGHMVTIFICRDHRFNLKYSEGYSSNKRDFFIAATGVSSTALTLFLALHVPLLSSLPEICLKCESFWLPSFAASCSLPPILLTNRNTTPLTMHSAVSCMHDGIQERALVQSVGITTTTLIDALIFTWTNSFLRMNITSTNGCSSKMSRRT